MKMTRKKENIDQLKTHMVIFSIISMLYGKGKLSGNIKIKMISKFLLGRLCGYQKKSGICDEAYEIS